MKLPMKLPTLSLAVLVGISLVTPALAVINIDYVSVGHAGNAADSTGHGAVAYAYQIAKNETTISQYAGFLNAVAATDTYFLYNSSMTTSFINGISRSGSSGSFTYSVAPGSGNKPITYVSWFDAARFTNWLHNGQPTGTQNNLTTEDGAYTLNGAMSGVSVSKNVGATVWIPSENEWYKAAYYDPNKGGPGIGGYWAQATQSNTVTGNTVGVATSANYFDGDYVGSGNSSFPTANALTDVGAYGLNSDSAYGTNDQAGNVWEWNDAVIGSSRGLRGGAWGSDASGLPASGRDSTTPTVQTNDVGFRVASVPEPSAVLMTMLSASACLMRRRRSTL
jgi:formylglycine-generating enzyme required for sulfatase activity